jgi:hypothetical protein
MLESSQPTAARCITCMHTLCTFSRIPSILHTTPINPQMSMMSIGTRTARHAGPVHLFFFFLQSFFPVADGSYVSLPLLFRSGLQHPTLLLSTPKCAPNTRGAKKKTYRCQTRVSAGQWETITSIPIPPRPQPRNPSRSGTRWVAYRAGCAGPYRCWQCRWRRRHAHRAHHGHPVLYLPP